jgi:hypothetical protein
MLNDYCRMHVQTWLLSSDFCLSFSEEEGVSRDVGRRRVRVLLLLRGVDLSLLHLKNNNFVLTRNFYLEKNSDIQLPRICVMLRKNNYKLRLRKSKSL